MVDRQEPANARDGDDDGDALPHGALPLPRVGQKGPGGCGFTGCMYVVMVGAAIALTLMIILALTRVWITPAIPRM